MAPKILTHRRIPTFLRLLSRRVRRGSKKRNEVHLPPTGPVVPHLPSELLAEIFWHLTQMPPYGGERSLAPVMLVCHRWRDIAVSTPDLWSTIKFTSEGATRVETLLQRSKSVPVDIIVDRTPFPNAIEVLPPRQSRIRNLCLVDTPQSIVRGLLASLNAVGAPNLELLSIIYPDPSGTSLDAGLVPSLFADCVPRIRHLVIDVFSLPWTSSIFRGLTTLHIHREHNDVHPSSDVFLSVLESCPALEHLDLFHAGPILLPPTSTPDKATSTFAKRRVSLPRLKCLALEVGDLPQCMYTLSHLTLPSTAGLVFAIRAPDGWEILDALRAVKHVTEQSCIALETDMSDVAGISFTPNKTEEAALHTSVMLLFLSGPFLSLKFTNLSHTSIKWFPKFGLIHSELGMPLPSRLLVEMNGDDMLTVEEWKEGLRGWPNLDHLVVTDANYGILVEALDPVTSCVCEDCSKGDLICPKLQNFGIHRTRPQDDATQTADAEMLRHLGSCLKRRLERGSKLHELSYRHVQVKRAPLKKYARDVVEFTLLDDLPPPGEGEQDRFARYPPVVKDAVRCLVF
ncbi:hypothetical protein JAAARDRAFT_209332 [Jaapia argillacea MUCL 33604]|uniref:F-box domain-containing protein n=1 Tax=Jaapia argillacea MUCL 33604 TaxID=933084 RepID=A0A067PWC4_9AGAM|nr:hypothetical protein JAAARDRAFT_209332 [Jaapia argillacea MUCL 33604]